MPNKSIVYIVEDDKAFQDALQLLVKTVDLECRIFGSAQAFLDAFDPENHAGPQCLVADVRLPGMSGMELQQILIEREIPLPMVVISGHGDVPMAVEVVKKGAVDFIEKPFRHQQLLDSIQQALAESEKTLKTRKSRLKNTDRLARLTRRQRQVMDLVIAGKSNKTIADELELSIKTVEHHRSLVMKNMHAKSIADLVKMATAAKEK